MKQIPVYFKSDFPAILASETQWGGVPFRLNFYTASPSRAFVASFDGETYENCRLLEDGRLEIAFNQKDGTVQTLMGIGKLMLAPEFYLDNDAFRDHICNQFVKPFSPVFIDEKGEKYNLVLGLEGAASIVAIGTLPPFYQKGEKGDKGDKGDQGEQGPVGPVGPQGPQGIQGIQGEKGDKGDQGIQGEVGPRGEKGDKGDAFKYSDFTPEQLEGLRGPRGFQGEKGDKGDQGIQGVQGEVGPVGPQGETGPQGPQGIQGIQGEKGEKGDKGEPGASVTFFPAVTIFGQPHIDGPQISGFSANDYLQFPFVVNFAGRPWELHFDIATGADVSKQHNIFDSQFGLAFAFANGHFVMAMSSNGTSWDLGANEGTHAILSNQTYHIRMSWDGSVYKLEFSTDEVTWTTDITVSSTASLYPRQIVIGKDIFTGEHFYNGSINFADARLTIAGVIVWEGMEEVGTATRMAIDMSNIDEAGMKKVNDVAMAGEVGQKLGDLSAEVSELEKKTGNISRKRYAAGDIVFSKEEIPSGIVVRLTMEVTGVVGNVSVYDDSDNIIKYFQLAASEAESKTFDDYTLPENYAYLKAYPGYPSIYLTVTKIEADVNLLKETNKIALGNRENIERMLPKVSKLDDSTTEIQRTVNGFDGVIADGEFEIEQVLFTSKDAKPGDVVYVAPYVSPCPNFCIVYDRDGNVIKRTNNFFWIIIPESFSHAIIDEGSVPASSWKVTNFSAARLGNTADIKFVKDKFETTTLYDFTIKNKELDNYGYLKNSTDKDSTEIISIEHAKKLSAINAFYWAFYADAEGQQLIGDVGAYYGSYTDWKDFEIPQGANYVAFSARQSSSAYKVRVISDVVPNNDDSLVINASDFGVISAKVVLPSDSHDINDAQEIVSVNFDDESSFKVVLKKSVTSVQDDAVGTCPVPKYNAGLIAGYAIKKVSNWEMGKGVSMNKGIIITSPTERYSGKYSVSFKSVKINTSGKPTIIAWYYDEGNTKVDVVYKAQPLTDFILDAPVGAKYFAMSTDINDDSASVEFDTCAMSIDSKILVPDGWNKDLLLGSDAILLRFNGDVDDAANQDIRLKIDDAGVTIYHGTTNAVIHSFPKTQYPNAEALYAAFAQLDDFDAEMLSASGVVFDDFIKGDVSLVNQYYIQEQSAPGVDVLNWDAFPFYFTTKEMGAVYNIEIGVDNNAPDKKLQAVVNGYPLYSSNDCERFVNYPLSVVYGNNVVVKKKLFNRDGEFMCPVRRMFYVEGMTNGNVNGTGAAAWTSRAAVEEAIDIMQSNGGHNVRYPDLIKEVLGDYKTSGPQFTLTSDDNGLTLYTSAEIRNMFARKGVTPSTFFMVGNINFEDDIPTIKACINSGYYCGVHQPVGYGQAIPVGRFTYAQLVDAVNRTFTTFVEKFGIQPIIWDFHGDGENYNHVRYILNHGYTFLMGGGYANDYGIVSTITRHRIKRFGIRPDANGQNVRMPDEWLFKKY